MLSSVGGTVSMVVVRLYLGVVCVSFAVCARLSGISIFFAAFWYARLVITAKFYV